MHKCVNCQFVRDIPGSCYKEFGLYYCDEDKVKCENYGHPVRLEDSACKHFKPLVVDCDASVKIKQYCKHYYALDEIGNVMASSRLKDIAITKAYKYIRDTFYCRKSN